MSTFMHHVVELVRDILAGTVVVLVSHLPLSLAPKADSL